MESQGHVPPEWLRELNLDVSIDEILSAEMGFIYAGLHALENQNTDAWSTPHAAIVGKYWL
jgi:hypothetical protein